MVRFRYRMWQFFTALRNRPTEAEIVAVKAWLSPELFLLFTGMSPAEQAHALRVFTAVQAAGLDHKPLREAALLHDLGKTLHPLNPWERALVVLGNAFFPRRVGKWGAGEPKSWRKAFVVGAQHAEWGAQMLEQAGADALTVRLVRQHQTASPGGLSAEEAVLMKVLKEADNQS